MPQHNPPDRYILVATWQCRPTIANSPLLAQLQVPPSLLLIKVFCLDPDGLLVCASEIMESLLSIPCRYHYVRGGIELGPGLLQEVHPYSRQDVPREGGLSPQHGNNLIEEDLPFALVQDFVGVPFLGAGLVRGIGCVGSSARAAKAAR